MYSGLLNHCLRESTSALRQNKLACRTPLIPQNLGNPFTLEYLFVVLARIFT